jgi:hypothetical protein
VSLGAVGGLAGRRGRRRAVDTVLPNLDVLVG